MSNMVTVPSGKIVTQVIEGIDEPLLTHNTKYYVLFLRREDETNTDELLEWARTEINNREPFVSFAEVYQSIKTRQGSSEE